MIRRNIKIAIVAACCLVQAGAAEDRTSDPADPKRSAELVATVHFTKAEFEGLVRQMNEVASLLARIRLRSIDHPDVAAGVAARDRGQAEAGLGHLLDAVRVAPPELRDDVRLTMLGVFAELGEHHPLATRFRRRLAQALY